MLIYPRNLSIPDYAIKIKTITIVDDFFIFCN